MGGEQALALQIIAATLASVCVGVVWYTPLLFGRLWWSVQFPGRKFGDGVGSSSVQPLLSAASYLLQNSAVVVLMSWMRETEKSLLVPLLTAGVMVTVNASANFPHYLYGRQPLTLYAIYCGHDAVQLVAAVLVAYALS